MMQVQFFILLTKLLIMLLVACLSYT